MAKENKFFYPQIKEPFAAYACPGNTVMYRVFVPGSTGEHVFHPCDITHNGMLYKSRKMTHKFYGQSNACFGNAVKHRILTSMLMSW